MLTIATSAWNRNEGRLEKTRSERVANYRVKWSGEIWPKRLGTDLGLRSVSKRSGLREASVRLRCSTKLAESDSPLRTSDVEPLVLLPPWNIDQSFHDDAETLITHPSLPAKMLRWPPSGESHKIS